MRKGSMFFLESGSEVLPKKWRNYLSDEMTSDELEYQLKFCRKRHIDGVEGFRLSQGCDNSELIYADSSLEPHQLKIIFEVDEDDLINFKKIETIETTTQF